MPKEKKSRGRPSGEVRSKKFCITLWPDPEALPAFKHDDGLIMEHLGLLVTRIIKNTKPVGLCGQFELGEEKNGLHFQGFIQFKWQRNIVAVKSATGMHWLHIEPSRDKHPNSARAIEYCTDPDKRFPGSKPTYFGNIRAPLPPCPDPLEGKTLHVWQLALKAYVLEHEAISDREIIWIHEPVGGVGKSMFLKHLSVVYPDTVQYAGGCTFKDVAALLKHRANPPEIRGQPTMVARPHPKLITFDIPRADFDDINYSDLERLKNGHFISGKYMPQEVLMANPNILIFANARPRHSSMSSDRWTVFTITEAGRLQPELVGGKPWPDVSHPILDLQDEFIAEDMAAELVDESE